MECCSCGGNSYHESNEKTVKKTSDKIKEYKADLKKKADDTKDIT
jgi:hypothetical protein